MEEKEKMRNPQEICSYYQCTPECFVIDADDERINIDHCGDIFSFAFYEISEVGIDFDNENDYVLKIRCMREVHYFQFVVQNDALKVCIEILNQISLLPEHRDTSESS